jgi:DNA-binding CsgD family transcriptional regulator
MPKLASAPSAALDRALREAAETVTLAHLGEQVLPLVCRAARAGVALLYRFDDAARASFLGGELVEPIGHYMRHYFHTDPLQDVPKRLSGGRRIVVPTRLVDAQAYRRSAAYGEFYTAHEIEHVACVWITQLPYGRPGMTGIFLGRTRRAGDFEAQDHRRLARALPALGAAVARADRLRDLELQRDALAAIVGGRAAPPRVVLSHTGAVIWMSPDAARILAMVGSPIDPLRAAARRVHDAALGLTSSAPETEVHLPGGVVASLAILRTSTVAPLVLIELGLPVAVGVRATELARRFALTRTEGAVLARIAEGLGNREIAARADVSIETVRTHVRRILGKLGVRSRVEAALVAARAR